MAENDIFSQAKQDLADIFRIAAERGEKHALGHTIWHELGEISTTNNTNNRVLRSPEGSVTEPGAHGALLEFRDGMNMKKLHELAEKLRAAPQR